MKHPAEQLCADYFGEILKPLIDAKVMFWVAGGAVRSWFQERAVTSDIDVWFPSEDEWNKAKAVASQVWTLTKETPASANYAAGRKWIQLIRKHYFPTPEATPNGFGSNRRTRTKARQWAYGTTVCSVMNAGSRSCHEAKFTPGS